MSIRVRGFALLALAVVGLVCGALLWPGAAAQSLTGRPGRRVVLITLDGFGAADLNNPQLPLPNLRRLAAEGAQAEAMTVSTPSVTWPNHTTLVTGVTPARHGVLANGLIEPRTLSGPPMAINPRRSKDEMCRVQTLYDAAHEAGLLTAEINWPVTRGAKSLDWSFPDHPQPIRYTTPSLLQELRSQSLLAEPTDAAFAASSPLLRDYIWTQSAVHLIRRYKPNLLLLHLLLTDGVQHQRAPQTSEANAALALADRNVGDVLQAIRDAGLRDRAAVIVTADHGFAAATRAINPNVRLRREGLIRAEAADAPEYDAQSIAEGGVALVYVPRAKLQPELLRKTRRALAGLEGVGQVYDPEQYGALGLPTPGFDPQAPNLLLSARDGYSFRNDVAGEEVVRLPLPIGVHGYVASNPKMDALFVAAGAGIRKSVRLGRIRNLDVAPTAARILGIALRDADGKPLEALLEAER